MGRWMMRSLRRPRQARREADDSSKEKHFSPLRSRGREESPIWYGFSWRRWRLGGDFFYVAQRESPHPAHPGHAGMGRDVCNDQGRAARYFAAAAERSTNGGGGGYAADSLCRLATEDDDRSSARRRSGGNIF